MPRPQPPPRGLEEGLLFGKRRPSLFSLSVCAVIDLRSRVPVHGMDAWTRGRVDREYFPMCDAEHRGLGGALTAARPLCTVQFDVILDDLGNFV